MGIKLQKTIENVPSPVFKDIGQFEMFLKQSNKDKCLENNHPKRYTDEELEEIISSFTPKFGVKIFQV
jgi:hypothetical protein